MSKKYFDYSELKNKNIGDQIKPSGTMGSHHFQIESKTENEVRISGWNTKSQKTGEAIVKNGGTLGYDRGQVWAIKPVSEMSPIQVFRQRFCFSKENVLIMPLNELEQYKLPRQKEIGSLENRAYWEFIGRYSAFTSTYVRKSTYDFENRRRDKAFIVKEYYEEGLKELTESLEKYIKTGHPTKIELDDQIKVLSVFIDGEYMSMRKFIDDDINARKMALEESRNS